MELEELRIDLAQEEQEEAERRKEQEAMRQRVRKRLELIQAYQQQVEYKTQRLEKERQEEQVYREQVLDLMVVDEKVCRRRSSGAIEPSKETHETDRTQACCRCFGGGTPQDESQEEGARRTGKDQGAGTREIQANGHRTGKTTLAARTCHQARRLPSKSTMAYFRVSCAMQKISNCLMKNSRPNLVKSDIIASLSFESVLS
ncbi:hypothetical protein EDD86DRAFT_87151 [Gorgonomyces haynaldii]|nr:hypothetical protein EDD86DRAFT_87151 [Gorgonomyces haynaldii]